MAKNSYMLLLSPIRLWSIPGLMLEPEMIPEKHGYANVYLFVLLGWVDVE